MTYVERVVSFRCRDASLTGVLAQPEAPRRTGVVIVVGGPQYRVGSHRQFVLLARALAEAGYAALRFDYRGMGDSEGDPAGFECVDDDIRAAMDALCSSVPAVGSVVLWGLCDAASAALLSCAGRVDRRLAGLCLANPWLRSATTLARTTLKHYYSRRIVQPAFWQKMLRGEGIGAALKGFVRDTQAAADRDVPQQAFHLRMASGWRQFQGPILLFLSGNDYTAREFVEGIQSAPAWQEAMARPALTVHELAQADHTFSCSRDRHEVERLTLLWLASVDRAQPGQELRHPEASAQ